MDSTGEVQGQTTRVEMGENDVTIHFIETRLRDLLVDHLLHEHLQGLLVWLTTSAQTLPDWLIK
jgi:hypothetical protein